MVGDQVSAFIDLVLTNGWDCSDNFAQFEFVKDGGLSGSIKTDHKNTAVLLSEELGKGLRHEHTHFWRRN